MATQENPIIRDALRQAVPLLGIVFAVTAVCNICTILVSIYNMELYMRVLNTRNLRTLEALSVGLVVVMAVHFSLEYLRSALYQAVAGRLLRRLALPTLLAAAGGHSQPPDQPVRDLSALRGFVAGPTIGVLLDLVWAPLFIATLFVMHWAYGAYAIVCTLIIVGLNLLAEMTAKRPLTEAGEASLRSLSEIATLIRNPEPVEAMGMFPAVARRWRRSQATMLDLTYCGLRRTKALAAAAKSFRSLVTAGMVALGLLMCLKGEVNAGSMLAGNLLMARLLLPFERLVGSWRQWVGARAALQRIASALSAPRDRRSTRALPRPEGRLVLDRVAYMPVGVDRPILRGVSITIQPGEMIGVVGPSSAGKSTLLRLILGIVEPSNGGIYLDGSNTFLWERADFGRHVGFLPQKVALIDGTIAENISRLNEAPPSEIIAAARKAGIHDLIAALPRGYDTPISAVGYELSGGQRQRIGLARALFGSPRLLILDEPNANLDHEGEVALLAALAAAKRAGTTVLLVSHRPAMVAAADKLLLLQDGLVEAFGPPDTVMAKIAGPSCRPALASAGHGALAQGVA